MPQISESAVCLRISGDDLLPEEISELLGYEPTVGYRKGDIRYIGPSKREKKERSGSWRLDVDRVRPGNLNDQINEIFSKLTSDISAWERISKRYSVYLFCGLFMKEGNEGIEISASTLKLLGDRGVEMGLDIYDPS